ncbi:hypothetical protein M9Y10_034851, partial [Tritrichomonas musculus]
HFLKMALCFAHKSFARFGSIVGIAKGGEKKTVEYEDDQNLFEVLTGAGIMDASGTCNGNVACGKCRVKVVSGTVPEAEDDEKELLDGAPAGARLACAIVLGGDANGAVFQVL